jgi:hypothetical protein
MTQTKTYTTSPIRMNEEETHMKAMMYHTDGSPAALERKEEDMNHYRRTAVLVGVLFLISTATLGWFPDGWRCSVLSATRRCCW